MRQIVSFTLLLGLFFGCAGSDQDRQPMVNIDDLAVTIRDHPRSYFFSDKRGAFLVGTAGQGAELRQEWSVDGFTVLRRIGIMTVDKMPVDVQAVDSVCVTPLEAVRYYRNGIVETTTVLDRIPGDVRAHGVIVTVRASSPHDIMLGLQPDPEFVPASRADDPKLLDLKGHGWSLGGYAGDHGEVRQNTMAVKQALSATFIVLCRAGDSAGYLAQRTLEGVEQLRVARRNRMEELLNRAYVHTSDRNVTKALRWMQVSLDGLVVESSGTMFLAALPWYGVPDEWGNAVAPAGLDAATGNYAQTSSILRETSRRRELDDEGQGWFAREAYEHVIASGDTGLVRQVYPCVQTQLAATAGTCTDKFNLICEGSVVQRSNRTAARQALWYFHQTIGSIFASFMGDTVHAGLWASRADLTSRSFNAMFVDTSRNVVFERIGPDGRGVSAMRPGALLSIDMLESEAVRQNTVKGVVKALLRPDGIVDPTIRERDVTGVIPNWMAGQVVYALSRYDCQHLSWPITNRLAERALNTDMVGVLPEMYEANEEARAVGSLASPAAMAEFVRSWYQDYFGVHINMTTNSIALEPKLPDAISGADFTIFAGSRAIAARYERTAEHDQVMLKGNELTDSLRVTFLWMMRNGDAWRGATTLYPGVTTTLMFGEKSATGFLNGKEMQLENVRHLMGFSLKAEFEKP